MVSGEGNETGAPNDGFLKYIENTFLAIHKLVSQCSAILGELESFRNYEEFRIIFPKILDAI